MDIHFNNGIQLRNSQIKIGDEMQNEKIGKTGIGPRMRVWRKDEHLKGYEFAKLIGISQGSLSDIENNKSDPSAHTLVKFLTRTDVDWQWLLTGEYGSLKEGIRPKKDKPRVVNVNPGSELIIRAVRKNG